MKKVFLLLFSFIFIITGCSYNTSVEYYKNNGYTNFGPFEYSHDINHEDGTIETIEEVSILKKEISANELVFLEYGNDQILSINTTFKKDNIGVNFSYDISNDYYYCYVYDTVDETVFHINPGCSNTYVYYEENAPDLAKEIEAIYMNFAISMDNLVIGNSTPVEEAVNTLETGQGEHWD